MLKEVLKYQFKVTDIPDQKFDAKILKGLREECEKLTGISEDFKPYHVYARSQGLAIGGAIASHHGSILWLDSIFVEKSYRQQGIGGQLIDHLLNYAKQSGLFEYSLNTYFPDSYKFFQKFDFETVAVIPNWKYGLNCHLMRKEI